MIKINLTPPEELENPLWYVPDVAFLVVMVLVAYFGGSYWLNEQRVQIAIVQEQQAKVEDDIKTLNEDVAQHKSLEGEIKNFENNLSALSNISQSKVHKFRPIIVLEHVQNLLPTGVWLEAFELNTENNRVLLAGRAFDNLMISEFMAAVRSTRNQDLDITDFRTYIYFEELLLGEVQLQNGSDLRDRFIDQANGQSRPQIDVSSYTLEFDYKERRDNSPLPVSFNFDIRQDFKPMRIARIR